MGLTRSQWARRAFLALFIASFFQGVSLLVPSKLGSATLTAAKDQLGNARLSFSSALEGTHVVGQTTINIDTSNYPDENTNHLFPGDTAHIGSNNYTVGTIIDSDTFTLTSGLLSGDTSDDTKIYVDQDTNAIHTISFTTASFVANGAIRILVPANANNTNNSDGNPDADGFDLNSVTAGDVTCPGDTTGFDFVAGTATDAGTSGWHTFECRYSGSGNTSTALSLTIGVTQKLLNPAPESSHVQGTADDYTITIRNLNSAYSTVDEVNAKVVLIEGVRVSATVESTLSFSIAGVSAGSTNCGTNATSDVVTTVYSVPFGSISNFNAFYDAEQKLTVSTNANDGYEVRMYEDDELGKGGADSPFIADTLCDTGPCTHIAPQEWVTLSINGFGYSLQNSSGTDSEFEWDDTTPTTGFKAKQFPNYTEGSTQYTASGAEIMSYNDPVDGSSVFVCYRLKVSGTQAAGDYYNTITYIATPQF